MRGQQQPPVTITISVSEHQRKSRIAAQGKGRTLVGLTLDLTPDAANDLYRELFNKLAPVAAWRNHPLYQWGQRKIGNGRGPAR